MVAPVHAAGSSESRAERSFSKDMAYYLFPTPVDASTASQRTLEHNPNPTSIPTELLLDPSVSHTFLIRTPIKAVPSFAKLCGSQAGAVTGFNYFDPQEVGIAELKELFDFIRIEHSRNAVEGDEKVPMVIDSDELLKDPETVMKAWCGEVGIKYDDQMLHWDRDLIAEHLSVTLSFCLMILILISFESIQCEMDRMACICRSLVRNQ